VIQSGVVRVNGAVVREPGRRVEPGRDRVTVRGRPLPGRSAPATFMLHKPTGVITTLSDPEGRRTIRDFLPPGPRLFPVGRLDADTSGLLLLTNDGELAHHLMHPRYGVEKRYRVRLAAPAPPEALARLRRGVEIEPGLWGGPAAVRVTSERRDRPALLIRIREGRYRQVRRMCEAVGLEVRALARIGYGPLRLGDLPRGEVRRLTEHEVARLRAVTARPRPMAESGGRPGGRPDRGGRARRI
jgi:23S rRNA pseudouridine2605 synthase